MPFTPAHVAAVLPVAEPLRRAAPVALTALVVGSMAPDIPYYLPVPLDRAATHSVADAFTWTALMALVATTLWVFLVAPAARDLAPQWVRERLRPPERRPRLRDLPLAYAFAVAGVGTHLLWDGVSHLDGYVVRHHPSLLVVHGRWPLYQDIQLASSALGCLAVAGYVLVVLLLRRPHPVEPPRVTWQPVARTALLVAFVVGALIGQADSPNGDPSHDLGVFVATRSIGLSTAAVAVICAVWWVQVLVRREPAQPVASQSSTSRR